MLGAYGTFVGYLAKYSFNNPDSEAWYGVSNNIEMLTRTEAELTFISAGDVENIHDTFVKWFFWGFMNQVVPIGGVLLGVIVALMAAQLGQCLIYLTCCGSCVSGLAWWIAGMVWRLRASGMYAAGDVNNSADLMNPLTEEEWYNLVRE